MRINRIKPKVGRRKNEKMYRISGAILKFLFFYFMMYGISIITSEACPAQQTGSTLYQATQTDCPCSQSTSGTLRFYDNELQICDGDRYVSVSEGYHELGSKTNPAKSCNDIEEMQSEAKSGMYYLDVGGAVVKAYCYLDEMCGSKGWTMIMKIDGTKTTFHYASSYWTNKATYNIAGAFGGLDDQETKLETFSHLSFNLLCLGFASGNKTSWMSLPYPADSLHSLIADGEYRNTSIGREAWKGLIPNSSLHKECHKEGFNIRAGFANMARIGVLGSSKKDCENLESRIGFGTGGNECGQDDWNTAGNEARCGSDNGNQSIRGMGYILARTILEKEYSTSSPTVDPNADFSFGSLLNPAKSCLDIQQVMGENATSGLYYLSLNNKTVATYCHMETICDGTGWTMIMKIDGHEETFHYTSSYWTDKLTYNTGVASGGLDNQEAKLETYSEFPFETLCLGMRTNNATNWMSLKHPAKSLYSLIANNKETPTNQGLKAWQVLIPGSSLQTRCMREGFNVDEQGTAVRIGIIGNNERKCGSADSRIGFGTAGSRCGQDDTNSAGNEARCRSDNGDKSIKAFGYIFAREI